MSVSAWLAGASSRLRIVRVPTILASGVAAASLLLSRNRPAGTIGNDTDAGSGDHPEPPGERRGGLDVEQEIRAVLARLIELPTARLVRLELAVQPELAVRADRTAFQQIVAALVTHAVSQAPIGRVLVTGGRRGGRVQITVADDGAGADPLRQAAALREAEGLLALQGGTLEISAHPGEGTTLAARWPDAPKDGPAQSDSSTSIPAREDTSSKAPQAIAQQLA